MIENWKIINNMTWFKHSSLASFDDDLVNIREEMGFAGIGAYWQIIELITLHKNSCPLNRVLSLSCKGFTKRKILRVIELADSLCISNENYVCTSNSKTDAEQAVSSDFARQKNTEENVCSALPQQKNTEQSGAKARVIEEKKERIEKKTTQKKESCFSDFVAELKEEDGEWRNVVCMHSGIGKLLLAHWQEAVDQWREHVIAYDTVNEIFDYSRARYYFNSYVKQSTEAGRRLKEHLSALEAQPCEVEEKENDLWR